MNREGKEIVLLIHGCTWFGEYMCMYVHISRFRRIDVTRLLSVTSVK